ncbi:MAG: phosphate ABC transporter substrate-binding protein, partial [Bdellovibrionota bacterium]
ILDRSVPAMRNYWQQLIFSGRGVPPPELESDRAVVDYVSRHADAIGYVSPQANVRQNKIVTIK